MRFFMPNILLNGHEQELQTTVTIVTLLQDLQIPRAGTAVAIDGEIVPAPEHETRLVTAGMRVDIVRAVGGG